MTPLQIPDGADRETIVSLTLRQCALVIDPRYGKLSALADEFELHPTTLSLWIREGRIPIKAARRLQRRFGKKLVNVDLVSTP